jgi:hypothetical protein
MDYMKLGVSGLVGAIDEAAERNDAKKGRVENFKTWSDMVRLGAVLGGVAIQAAMPRYSRIGEGLAAGGASLLVKTLARAFVKETATASTSTASFQSRAAVGRYPSPARYPQFNLVPAA